MAKQKNTHENLGIDIHYTGRRRFINTDGSYNVKVVGDNILNFHPYRYLLKISSILFFLIATAAFFVINIFFGTIYFLMGNEAVSIANGHENVPFFFNCFYLSIQTFTKVRYGNLSPVGNLPNLIASINSLSGITFTAILTGLLFARFSKPSTKIMFSKNILIKKGKINPSLIFRVVNSSKNPIGNMELQVVATWLDIDTGHRKFKRLELEIETIKMFALNWTIHHVINENSPLFELSIDQIKEKNMEILVILSGQDEQSSQGIQVLHSYDDDTFKYGYNFEPMFETDEKGKITLHVNKLSDIYPMTQ